LKRSLLTVLILVTLLPAPALAAPKLRVDLPKKTKNACLRKAARLATVARYDDALDELASPKCSENLKPQEQVWISLMEGVLYHSLEQAPQSEEAFCRAFQEDPSARLPITNPSQSLRERFEELRSTCQAGSTPARAEAAPRAEAPAGPAQAEATPPATKTEVTPPPDAVVSRPPEPAVEPVPTSVPPETPADLGTPAAPALSLLDSLELHAGVHADLELNPREFRPLAGLGFQGSVLLGHGLRAGVGLTALGSARFLPRPVVLLLADVRLAYALIPRSEQFGLQVYATGGPLLYTLYPAAPGARAGAGLALDVSQFRVSLGAAYEWRYHYRLELGAPIIGLELGWKLR
jgi:hypothetical protein